MHSFEDAAGRGEVPKVQSTEAAAGWQAQSELAAESHYATLEPLCYSKLSRCFNSSYETTRTGAGA